MKAKFGMMMVDGRGKLGGHVMTKNRQGAAVRTKSSPVQRRTNTQQASKNRFTSLSQNWRDLTEPQRLAWNAAAPDFIRTNVFGDSYAPTGKNLYMLINQNLMLVNEVPISDVPFPVSPVAISALVFLVNTDVAQTLTFAPTPVAADNAWIIEATRPLSAGKYSPGSTFRKITVIPAATATGVSTFSAYSAVFGAPITGKKIFLRATPVNTVTGIRGIPLQTSGTTA